MAPKIIKQGTARASSVQQFFFSESPADLTSNNQYLRPELLSVPSAKIASPAAGPPGSAVADMAQLEKAAYDNGFIQGEKAGLEIAEKRVEEAMKRYAEAILGVDKLRSFLHAQVEREVVKLSVEVAKKIIHREINMDTDIIQTLIHVALGHVTDKSAVTIHLNPADYNYLLEQRSELSQSEGRDLTLLADKSIDRGGCFIKTECGDIDARIEEKFREVEHAFFEGSK
jgi:flagellar assembly protein FliH